MADEKIGLDLEVKLQGAQSLQDLKKVLKEARDNAIAIGEGSAEYQKFIKIAAGAKDEIKDMNERLLALDPGAKAAAFRGLGQTILGGFQAATGALAVFTGENEELNKILLKSIAITNALNGIQAIADSKKQLANIAIILGLKARQKAEEGVTGAVVKQTVVQRVLNTVMKASPVLLIVTAITTLIGTLAILYNKVTAVKNVIDGFFGAIKRIVNAIGDWLGVIDLQNIALNKNLELVRKQNEQINKQLELDNEHLRLMKASGKSVEDLEAAERQLLLTRLRAAENELKALMLIERRGKLTEEQEQQINDLNIAYVGFLADVAEFDRKVTERQIKESEERIKKYEEEKKRKAEIEKKAEEERFRKLMEQAQREVELENQLEDLRVELITNQFDRELAKAHLEHDRKMELLTGNTYEEIQLRDALNQQLLQQQEDIELRRKQSAIDAGKELERLIKEQRQREIDAAQAERDAKIMIASDLTNSLLAIGELFIKDEKKLEKIRKAQALVQIATDTAKAISSLIAVSQANPLNVPTFGAAGIAQYAAGLVQILTQVAKAKALLSGGGSGGGSVSAPSAPATQTPSAPIIPLNQRVQQSQIRRNDRGAEGEIIKTYVVSSEMTKSQRTEEVIRRRASR